jgi:hypothetical protein
MNEKPITAAMTSTSDHGTADAFTLGNIRLPPNPGCLAEQ